MKPIFKSIIFIISILVIIAVSGYYANEQSQKPVYGNITFSVDFPMENYSGSSSVTVFLNATWTGTVQFNFTNESCTNGFILVYLGSNQSSLQRNISYSNTISESTICNPYINQSWKLIHYYLPFYISSTNPHDKIVWILNNASQRIFRGYYAYNEFSEFGYPKFSSQKLELNREYIYI